MGRLVDLANVMLALDSACTVRFGAHVTQVMQNAVRDLPSPSEATTARRTAINRVMNHADDLTSSLDEVQKWAEGADVTEIVSLQQMAKLVSDKVELLANAKDNLLMKQLQSIRASRN